MCRRFGFGGLVAALTGVLLTAPGAWADHPLLRQLDPLKVDYTPIGHYGPTDRGGESAEIPQPGDVPEVGPNPSGKYVAYDMNVWESLALPSRHPGDNCNSLPEEKQHELCSPGDRDADDDGPSGTGFPVFGWCPDPFISGFIAGECQNNQLEYLEHYEQTMQEMLGDFGVVTHRYSFESPGRSDGGTGRGGYLDAAPGTAVNVSATIAGADHPEETVLVSGHYDFTDSGPAAAWDSAEGHTEVIRMAKIMSDYWRATGTRPSATVKFIPWDSEESGTFGSLDYVQNNIPPGEEDEVRGYFNVDPCAGAYPAFRNGNPASRVPQVLQLANPARWEEGSDTRARIEAFNKLASDPDSDDDWVDQTLDRLDDTLALGAGAPVPIFVSDREAEAGEAGGQSQRDEIETAVGGLLAFSSDYANFEDVGIPIFNFFPDYFGPHADGTPASAEGVGILHTPRDNLATINALTSPDQSGTNASEGWAKGQEFCAQMEAWGMLQPEMGGAQTSNGDVVAYFEALPNEAVPHQSVQFDAGGSYKYADVTQRALAGDLTYEWDFGDGATGSGKTADHAYDEVGKYTATLTVTSAAGGSDTMALPITVEPSRFSPPALQPVDPEDARDGRFSLAWDFEADRDGFRHFRVEQGDFRTILEDDASDLASAFEASTPTDPAIDRWQASDSDTQKNRGNIFRTGPRSFYTGVQRSNHHPGLEPNGGESVLTYKEPVQLPLGSPVLTYFSDFANDANDQGRVEVAIEDGDPNTHLDWDPVDVVGLDERDRDVMSVSEEPLDSRANFELRTIDLGRFGGKTVRLRWVYRLGDAQFLNVWRQGWYVDDVVIRTGTFSPIGTSTQQMFAVGGERLFQDGAGNLGESFEASTPTNGAIDGWQASDSDTEKNRGDLHRSRPRSFYTGVSRANHQPGVGPNDGESVLTLKEPVAIPSGQSTALSYWSDFANDANDAGRVEAAVDDGDPSTELVWETIDTVGLNARDRDTMSASEEPSDADANFEVRTTDLSRFAGNTIRLRWVYDLGDAQFLNVWRQGWYVDDIAIQAGALENGDYAYRVLAVYADDIESEPSNVETATVTGPEQEPEPQPVPLEKGQGENIEGVMRVPVAAATEVELAANWAFVATDDPDEGGPKQGGLVIVNIADPTKPFVQARWDATMGGLTDASYGDVDLSPDAKLAALTNAHCSSCAEGEVHWVALLDISDKSNPKLVGTVVDDATMDYVHTSTLDNKMLYTNPQVAAFFPQPGNAHVTGFDISDPSNPVKKATIADPAADAGLAHDSFIDHRPDGKTLMYAASVHKSDVFDITDPLEANWLQSTTSPQYTISHDVQPNHDRSIIVVDDEGAAGGQLDESVSACGKAGSGPASVDSGSVHFFEAEPDGTFANGGAVHLGSFNAPTNVNTGACVAHVFWQAPDENRMTQAYYRTGAFVLEFEDPANPKMLGWFVPKGGAMYWSNKPHNGYMYATDMEGHLDILKYTGEGGTRWPATAPPAEIQRSARQGVPYVPIDTGGGGGGKKPKKPKKPK